MRPVAPRPANRYVKKKRGDARGAIKEGLFPWEKNPFHHITLRKERPNKTKLSLEEIRQIEALELEEHALIWHVRCWFLFAFYAGGMWFSDVATVRWKHVIRQGDDLFVAYKMQKTKEGQSTLLVEQARRILEAYADRAGDEEATLFGILDRYDVSTPARLRQAIESRNALANKYLKKIQVQCGTQNEPHVPPRPAQPRRLPPEAGVLDLRHLEGARPRGHPHHGAVPEGVRPGGPCREDARSVLSCRVCAAVSLGRARRPTGRLG